MFGVQLMDIWGFKIGCKLIDEIVDFFFCVKINDCSLIWYVYVFVFVVFFKEICWLGWEIEIYKRCFFIYLSSF